MHEPVSFSLTDMPRPIMFELTVNTTYYLQLGYLPEGSWWVLEVISTLLLLQQS